MASEDRTTPRPRDLLVRAADRAKLVEETMRHPMNPKSEIHAVALSQKTGLERIAVNLLRIPPGKESFLFHLHHAEAEFMFVVSGTGVAEVGDEVLDIGPGDFLGFPPGTHAHHVRNTGREDLVYLSASDVVEVDVSDFPRAGKRLVRVGKDATVDPTALGESFWPTR